MAALLLITAPVAVRGLDGVYTLVKLTAAATAHGAVCLDGSPGAYYIRKPVNATPANRWIIFHEGGGWCYGDDNCFARSQTALGSSVNYTAAVGPMESGSLFDEFPEHTVVYAKYCDGGSWTGDATEPARTTDGKHAVYYRGRRLLDALLADLSARGLSSATEVLYSGCSAGALTAYVNMDYVRTKLPAAARVAGLGDAMFSLHHADFANTTNYYTGQFQWGYTAWNASRNVDRSCHDHFASAAGNESAAWVCFHGAVVLPFVQTPMLVVNSVYDTWQERGVIGLDPAICPGRVLPDGTVSLCNTSAPGGAAEEAFWLSYGAAMRTAMAAQPVRHGAFLTNCPTHCQASSLGNPSAPGRFLGPSIAAWYAGVMSTGQQANYEAPRWVASPGDGCVHQSG